MITKMNWNKIYFHSTNITRILKVGHFKINSHNLNHLIIPRLPKNYIIVKKLRFHICSCDNARFLHHAPYWHESINIIFIKKVKDVYVSLFLRISLYKD